MRKNHYQQPGLRGRGIRSYVINSGLCCFGYNDVLGRERKLLRPPQLACIITHLELQMSYAIHFSSGPKFLFSFCLQSFLFREPDGQTYRALSVQTTVYLSLYLSSFFFCFVSENVNSTRFWRSVMLMTFWQMKCNCLCRHHPQLNEWIHIQLNFS